MSDERDRLAKNDEPGTEKEDVEAHVLKGANQEPDSEGGDDEVEGHILKA
jgi:hypothetical protein